MIPSSLMCPPLTLAIRGLCALVCSSHTWLLWHARAKTTIATRNTVPGWNCTLLAASNIWLLSGQQSGVLIARQGWSFLRYSDQCNSILDLRVLFNYLLVHGTIENLGDGNTQRGRFMVGIQLIKFVPVRVIKLVILLHRFKFCKTKFL